MNMTQWQHYCSNYIIKDGIHVNAEHRRLSVYKESIESIHIKALEISYPVIMRLLGRRFFLKLTRDYIKYKNWQSTTIDDLGYDFDDFIADYKAVCSMNYLAEVAKIEWLVQSLAEKNINQMDVVQQLQDLLVSGEDFCVSLLPHVAFFSSSLGGIEIWLAHQEDTVADIDLNEIETTYWYCDNGRYKLTINSLDKLDFNFITSLKNRASVNDLCQQNDVEKVIQHLIVMIQREWLFIELIH